MFTDLDPVAIQTLNPKNLELVLYPTEQCNFRCTYCYEDFSIGRMNEDVLEGVKSLLRERMPGLTNLQLSWFGGEPLAAKDIVLDLSEYASSLCAQYGVALAGSMTTNGYLLTPRIAETFAGLGLRTYQISLDGLRETHDKTRVLAGGGGTFDKIWKVLLDLRETKIPFDILLRLHLTPENLDSVRGLAKKLREEILSDFRFRTYVKAVENLGGKNAGKFETLSGVTRQSAVSEINALLKPESPLAASKQDSAYVCYASRPNSLAVRANGNIQKCTVMLNDERNTVGKIQRDGRIFLDPEKMSAWMRGYWNGDSSDLACPAHNLPDQKKRKVISIRPL